MTRPWVRGGSDQMNVFSWACSSKNSSRKVLTDPHERNVKLSLKLASTQTPISTHSSPRCHNAHTNTSLTYMLAHRQNDLTGRYVCADFHGKFCVFSIFFARVRALSFSLARSLARYLLLSRARVLTHTQVPRRETDRSKKVISCNRSSPHVFACLRFCLPFWMSWAASGTGCGRGGGQGSLYVSSVRVRVCRQRTSAAFLREKNTFSILVLHSVFFLHKKPN